MRTRFVLSLLGLLVWSGPAHAAWYDWFTPNAELRLRFEDNRSTLNEADTQSYLNLITYGPELKNNAVFSYMVRTGFVGAPSPYVSYGFQMMYRNQKQAAFSYPTYDFAFGNELVVANQFYLDLHYKNWIRVLLGKHPMMFVLQKKNFFWDLDVMPVGATEMSEYTLHTRNWTHSFGLYLGQWLPIALVRNGFQSTFFIEQLRYRGEYGPERRGFIVDAALSLDKFFGFDQFVAAAASAPADVKVTQNADGTIKTTSTPRQDYGATNKPAIVGSNPLWITLFANFAVKNIWHRPVIVHGGFIRNLAYGPAANVAPIYPCTPNCKSLIDPNAGVVGVTYGETVRPWTFALTYLYQHKGIASVVNGWTDESWGSNLSGHRLELDYMFIKYLSLQVAWRYFKEADGRDRFGAPLLDAYQRAYYSSLKVTLGGKF